MPLTFNQRNEIQAEYIGPDRLLKHETALIKQDKQHGFVRAQFDTIDLFNSEGIQVGINWHLYRAEFFTDVTPARQILFGAMKAIHRQGIRKYLEEMAEQAYDLDGEQVSALTALSLCNFNPSHVKSQLDQIDKLLAKDYERQKP